MSSIVGANATNYFVNRFGASALTACGILWFWHNIRPLVGYSGGIAAAVACVAIILLTLYQPLTRWQISEGRM